VLMSDDLHGVANAVGLSRATLRNIKENLFWAFAYNVALVPLAAGVTDPAEDEAIHSWMMHPGAPPVQADPKATPL